MRAATWLLRTHGSFGLALSCSKSQAMDAIWRLSSTFRSSQRILIMCCAIKYPKKQSVTWLKAAHYEYVNTSSNMFKYTLKSWSQLAAQHTPLYWYGILPNFEPHFIPCDIAWCPIPVSNQSITHKSRIQGLTCNNFRPTNRTSDVRSDLTKANATVAKMCTSPAFNCTKQNTRADLAMCFRAFFPNFYTEETQCCGKTHDVYSQTVHKQTAQSLERIYWFLKCTTTIINISQINMSFLIT